MENPATNRDLMRRAPSTVVVIAVTLAFVALLGAIVAVTLADKSTAPIDGLIDRGLALLGALGGAGALAYSASGARSAAAAQEQTNGSLDARMRAAVAAGIAAALDGQDNVHGAPPVGRHADE